MKLSHITEARYAGDHPIVQEIKQALKVNEPVDVTITDERRAQDAIRGIVKAFGKPTRHEEEEEDQYGLMAWDFPSDTTLQIIYGRGVWANVELF